MPDGGGWRYVGRAQGDRHRAATPGKPRSKHRGPLIGTAFVHTIIDDQSRGTRDIEPGVNPDSAGPGLCAHRTDGPQGCVSSLCGSE